MPDANRASFPRPTRMPETGIPAPAESVQGGFSWGQFILYGLIALIVFSPLPQGSVLEWAVLAIQLAALGLAAAWVMRTPKPAVNPFLLKALKWPRRLFLGFWVVVLVQVIPLPKFLVKVISPGTYSFLSTYSPEFGRSSTVTLSLAPGQTLRQALLWLTYFLVGLIIIRNINRFAQIQKLLTAIVLVGVFEALFGLFELSSGSPSLLLYSKTLHLDSVTGTFVNRNHLAGYLEMVLPLAIGLILSRIGIFAFRDPKARRNWRQVLPQLGGRSLAVNLLLCLAVLVMAAGLVKSQSRSGVFLMFFSFLLFAEIIIFHFSEAKERQRLSRNFINISFFIVLGFSLYIGLGTIVNRFAADDTLFRGGRTIFWGNVTSMIGDYPLLGTGLGTFASVYPLYDKSGFEMRLVHAHNDYLEAFSEVGLLGGALLLAGIIFLMVKVFLAWRSRRSTEIKGLALGGFVSLVVILSHSLTDFNMHIPANALLFTIILAVTAVTAFHKKSA